MANVGPAVLGEDLHQILLDFDGILAVARAPGQIEAMGKATDVGVDDEAFILSKPRTEDHVCRLSSNTRQLQQGRHVVGNFTIELLLDERRRAFDVLCLVAKEAGRLNVLFDLSLICGGKIPGIPESLEERRRDHVDALVSALGREDRCD